MSAEVIDGQTLPGDRLWAVVHKAGNAADGEWAPCRNFLRAASSPRLMAVTLARDGRSFILSHPERPDLRIDPEKDGASLIEWLRPLVDPTRTVPALLVQAPADRGLTDSASPTISLASASSLRALGQRLGRTISPHRFRNNIWIDGTDGPWQEFEWVGRQLRIGGALFEVTKRLDRCMATAANPETGLRDTDVLGALDSFGHQDFGVALVATRSGRIATGDRVEVN